MRARQHSKTVHGTTWVFLPHATVCLLVLWPASLTPLTSLCLCLAQDYPLSDRKGVLAGLLDRERISVVTRALVSHPAGRLSLACRRVIVLGAFTHQTPLADWGEVSGERVSTGGRPRGMMCRSIADGHNSTLPVTALGLSLLQSSRLPVVTQPGRHPAQWCVVSIQDRLMERPQQHGL